MSPLRIAFLLMILVPVGPVLAQQPALIGYYAGDGSDLPERDLSPLSHVIWCFLHLEGDSVRRPDDAHMQVIADLVARKELQPELKVLLSLGGWGGCATCSEVFARKEGRSGFAHSLKALLDETGADGIDLDWEYPAVQGPPGHPFAPADREHFTALVRTLREVLAPDAEISFAAGGTDACLLQGFDWPAVMPLVDRVHLMSYDLVHGYSTTSGHHTPLYSTPEQELSTDHAVKLMLDQGVPRDKLVIGAAFYGRVFQVADTLNRGLYRPGAFKHGVSHRDVDTTITPEHGWTWYWDRFAQAPYAFDPVGLRFWTGDDATSIVAKCAYVRDRDLGGIMFWQLRDDKLQGGLLEVMERTLRE